MWKNWIQVILKPKSALIVVDVQNDFISGSLAINGSSAGHKGEEVVPVINELTSSIAFEKVFYSQDWHPEDHISFYDNKHIRKFHTTDNKTPEDVLLYDTVVFEGPPQTPQKLWPTHCVQQTWGSQLHPHLNVSDHSIRVFKGTHPHIDSYSVFWDNQRLNQTNLNQLLQSLAITDVYVCGLCLDVCVGFTALDASQLGYRTVVIDDASRGLDHNHIRAIKDQFTDNHVVVVTADRVQAMVTGADRRPELAFNLALSRR
ncbi:unnamed protein product [Oppiella nova]|uniref:nicotinamidase n=1 Tax=Oppiella nova TaxID=334625 RepID=A0A7R9MRW4_9ACAR|nr:unnamed protein product [Oppiella nova]CAG2181692.1 unnamed protein product [Oppiella nova]